MRVYRPGPTDGFEWILPVREEDFEVFLNFDGTPRRQHWTPIEMTLVEEDEGQTFHPSDFPWLGGHVLIFRRSVLDAIGGLLSDFGEILPLTCGRLDLYVFNVHSIVDALDMNASSTERFPSSGRLMRIKRHVFMSQRLSGLHVFKIPQMLRGSLYVSELFVERVEEAGLKGLEFELMWEDR